MIKLYQAAMSTCVQKVRFTLEQKALPWQGIAVDLNSGENYSESFRKINPKAIIPVLDDGGDLIFESNNICLYLDEKYPDKPLMPANAKSRAEVRALMQLIDEQVHHDISALTYAIAFRPKILSKFDTQDKLEAYLQGMPDVGRRNAKREAITKGMESRDCHIALQRLSAVLTRLDGLLQNADYLVDNQLSLADIVYSPYMTRLSHLNLQVMWADKPAMIAWFERLCESKGYQQGVADFFIDEAIARMGDCGTKSWPQVKSILDRI